MAKLTIIGGQKVKGELVVDGSKNAVLPILAATVLNGGINIIKNCPDLKDVQIMIEILKILGCTVEKEGNVFIIDSSTINKTSIPETFAVEMRSSIFFMGPMLARFGNVTIGYPGGCDMTLALLK